MAKAEGMAIQTVPRLRLYTQEKWKKKRSMELYKRTISFLFKKGYILFFVAFLLGRALILSQLTPFTLPFFGAVYLIKRERAPIVMVGLILGGLTLSLTQGFVTFIACFSFLIVFRLTKKFVKNEWKALPFYISFMMLFIFMGQSFVINERIFLYDVLMGGVKGSLGFILTFIFLQSIPLILVNRRQKVLKTEEMVCLIIFLATTFTGMIGWTVYGLSIENIMSRFLVLLFALVAGATMGTTVGVVTGLIFSLANVSSFYTMSLLAFAGLLGGLLKEGKKIGVAIGLFVATLLITMYGEGGMDLSTSLLESIAAILLFFFTPIPLISKLSKKIPGTAEYHLEEHQFLRKMRDVTAQRIEKFSAVFEALSNSFRIFEDLHARQDHLKDEFEYLLNNVSEKTCRSCFKRDYCWSSQNANKTYELMQEIMYTLKEKDGYFSPSLSLEWEKYCSKSRKVIFSFHQELVLYEANQKLKEQMKESRRLVAEQLLGVSSVMEDFSKEIKRERDNHYKQEEMILESLQELGVQIEHIEIYSLEKGNVDIDMILPYCNGTGQCEKVIAPMLSDILNETIVVHKELCGEYPGDYCRATFRSADIYRIETGLAYAAKGGVFISGDSYSMIRISDNKYAIAISDGMGNGDRAQLESKETLKLLRKILQSGIDETVAIKSVNTILALRTDDEIFSTLDLVVIDLQTAKAKFLKVGSTPSFIKRGKKIIRVQANNLPIGIIREFDVDVVDEQLKAGDLLIMMSDGLYEGPNHVENNELWMRRKISELKTNDPQEVADLILEEVIRSRSGVIADDMTIVVARIEHNTPKWAPIPVHQYLKRA